MKNAVERLATELMKLSDDEWAQITARWNAGLAWPAVFGVAWEEISERLVDVDRGAARMMGDGAERVASPPQAAVSQWNQA